MVRIAIVNWQDRSETTLGIRQFRKIGEFHYVAQFPDYEWEDIEGCLSIRWANWSIGG
jgi:hypothetical protein